MKQQSLENVQRWMQSVITHPGGVEAGLAAPATQSHLEIAPAQLEQIVEPSLRQSSVDRLAVYAGAYYTRLIECLQAEFPVFHRAVGDDAFAEFAVDYLQRCPSQSYTLAKLGEKFVSYLSETKPAAEGDATIPGWADFLIDLATLERTVSEVFDGPGLERRPLTFDNELSAIDPKQWPQARLTVAPCLRLLSLRFSLNNYYTRMKQGNGNATIPPLQNAWLAITRRDYVVRRYELSHPQFVVLDALQRGQTVGDAIAAAAAVYVGEIDQLAADLRDWFRLWTAAPMFVQIEVND
ncbi:MAG TPA: DNA-binding domain-containing protein [Pirellulales bacterium]|nr:DNA-binding domain-containing protein [Pirellulales bacterium]